MKLLTVVGARPQFIKAAAIARVLRAPEFASISHSLVHTGQHFDENMNEIFFSEMQIPKPDFNLGISGSGHGAMTGQMLQKIEEVLMHVQPDTVLVYGDTNSTLAGALAAVKLHIPVAHVEAGLRSHNLRMPEEINRIVTDKVSKYLFCPTAAAREILKNEGVSEGQIEVVGDVMLDSALFYSKFAKPSAQIAELLDSEFYLCSIHRAENTDDVNNLKNVVELFTQLARQKAVIMPVHPRTQKYLKEYGLSLKGITTLPPVGYFDMLNLLQRCQMVLTDSGGLQKEAYFFEKPCVTLRTETEWTELVDAGANKVVGPDPEKAMAAIKWFQVNHMSFKHALYGDGTASEKILRRLQKS